MEIGLRVQLLSATPDMIANGIRPGMIGRICRTPGGNLGIQFEGHTDTGPLAGLHVTCVCTERYGQIIRVIDLCRPLN